MVGDKENVYVKDGKDEHFQGESNWHRMLAT